MNILKKAYSLVTETYTIIIVTNRLAAGSKCCRFIWHRLDNRFEAPKSPKKLNRGQDGKG